MNLIFIEDNLGFLLFQKIVNFNFPFMKTFSTLFVGILIQYVINFLKYKFFENLFCLLEVIIKGNVNSLLFIKLSQLTVSESFNLRIKMVFIRISLQSFDIRIILHLIFLFCICSAVYYKRNQAIKCFQIAAYLQTPI